MSFLQAKTMRDLFKTYDRSRLGVISMKDLMRAVPGEVKDFVTQADVESWLADVRGAKTVDDLARVSLHWKFFCN